MCSVEQRKGPQGICFFLNTKISETWHTPHHFEKLLLPSEHSSNNAIDNVHCHIHKIIITGYLPITTGTDCIVSNKMSTLPRSLYWETTDRSPMHRSPSHLLRFVALRHPAYFLIFNTNAPPFWWLKDWRIEPRNKLRLDRRFGLREELERNITLSRKWGSFEQSVPRHSLDFFRWPQYK